jgi:hypothetical protein
MKGRFDDGVKLLPCLLHIMSFLAYTSTLKIEAIFSFETLFSAGLHDVIPQKPGLARIFFYSEP